MFKDIISLENLYRAARRVVACRREKKDIADFLFHLEQNIDRLHRELGDKSYRHGGYELFEIRDPKKRIISKTVVRDRVVHHSFCNIVEPFFDRSFIYDSYACRKGKGTHRAIERVQKWCRACKYYVHLDIVQYFDSIQRGILKNMLEKRIKDEDTLWLANEIIDSSEKVKSPLNEASLHSKEQGLPLGNLTSQFFANVYLNELDQFVKHRLGIKFYLRYMDDIVILGNNKKEVLESAMRINDFVEQKLILRIHKRCFQVFQVSQGISFLGFRIYPFYRRVLPRGINRFRKRLKRLKKDYENRVISLEDVSRSIQASVAFLDFANSGKVKKELLRRFVL